LAKQKILEEERKEEQRIIRQREEMRIEALKEN